MTKVYKNRYGDVFTFTLQPDNNVLWKGDFQYCRIGMPNDYTKAYNQYVHDNKHNKDLMSFNTFKDQVHTYDDETHLFIYDKYLPMVESLKDKIDMVDASGGPYISAGMNLDYIGFTGLTVKEFEKKANGYLIITNQ
jgi:hypothetical protein